MSYEQSRSEVQRSHTLSMENRDKLRLTGVEDVSGFDESLVVLTTSNSPCAARVCTSSVSIWTPVSLRCAARCRS